MLAGQTCLTRLPCADMRRTRCATKVPGYGNGAARLRPKRRNATSRGLSAMVEN
jgi:hypothetical protein